jgi:hypothetical protein
VAVLTIAPQETWKYLLPAVVVLSFAIAVPVAWFIAPRMRTRT